MASPPAAAPLEFESPIPIENGGQVGMISVAAVSIFVPSVFVALRLYARTVTSRALDWSDYCILVALVFCIALHVDCWVMVMHGGFGFHTVDVAMRFGPDVLTSFFKGIMVFCILWNAAICFSKLSVLLLYTSLMPIKKMVIPARAIGLFIVLWNTGNILAQFLICRPFAMNWDQTIPGGKCGSQRDFYFIIGIINIITDILVLGLPMPFLFNLQLPMMKKLGVMGMFGVGIATCAISVYRQTTLPGLEFSDMTHSGLLATLFSALEPPVAISLACIPYLRPLMGSLRNPNSSKYNLSDSNTYSKNTRKSKLRTLDNLQDQGSGSEVQLQPVVVGVSVDAPGQHPGHLRKGDIAVETKWEVTSEV